LTIVTTVALFVLASGLILISKTWTSHRRGEDISITDLVAEDALQLRQQEALADELSASAQPAEFEVDTKPRLAG
jgi:hypothetical protein